MGLFSFPKKVGNKIFRRGDDDQPVEAAEAPVAEAAPVIETPMSLPPLDAASVPAAGGDPNAEWATAMQQMRDAEAVAAAAAAAPPSDEGTVVGGGASRVYVSRAGDSLDAIAAFFYGDPAHRQRLLDENPDLARHGEPLPSGVRMRVPEDAPVPAGMLVADNAAAESEVDYAADPAAAAMAAQTLADAVGQLGVAVEGLSVSIDGETATVRGVTETQEEREKVVLFIGNTAGIAQVDDQLEVRQPAPEAVFYTVESGDTLSGIAQAQYGDANAYMKIFEANQPMLSNPDLIYPGQVLRIPAL